MSHDEIQFMKLMQAKGLRVTEQRLQILDAICAGGGHINQAQILAEVRVYNRTLNASTVYRNLHLLCDLGLVSKHETADKQPVYEIVGAKPHHHLMCRHCGKTYHLHEADLSALRQQIQAQYGFLITAPHLILEGLCADCQKT